MADRTFHELYSLWIARGQQDEYVGTLVNAWIGQGGRATAVRRGRSYVDVGTVRGYRDAVMLLSGMVRAAGTPAEAAWSDATPATGAT